MRQPATLPAVAVHVRTTDVFTDERHPHSLVNAHQVADGVWARLVVLTGSLSFVFDDDADEPISVATGGDIVIPPRRVHHLQFDGPATFVLAFYRLPGAMAPETGTERMGLADLS
jgi:tellurite resistance-related uncharacterized protein